MTVLNRLTTAQRAVLRAVRVHAETHRIRRGEFEAGRFVPAGGHYARLGNTALIFDIAQGDDGDWYRHLAIADVRPGRMLGIDAIEEIAGELGIDVPIVSVADAQRVRNDRIGDVIHLYVREV
jgi:hypothetical protein